MLVRDPRARRRDVRALGPDPALPEHRGDSERPVRRGSGKLRHFPAQEVRARRPSPLRLGRRSRMGARGWL